MGTAVERVSSHKASVKRHWRWLLIALIVGVCVAFWANRVEGWSVF